MKLTLKVLSLSAMTLLLFACKEIDGKLFVSSEISLKNVSESHLSILPGEHEAAFKVTDNGKLIMQMNMGENQSQHEAFIFNLPEDVNIAFQGEKMVPAKDNGQDYDLRLKVGVDRSKGPETKKLVQCVHHTKQAIYIGPGQHGGFSSNQSRVPVYGKKQVTLHLETTLTTYEMDFISPQSKALLATLYASTTSNLEVQDFEGECFLK